MDEGRYEYRIARTPKIFIGYETRNYESETGILHYYRDFGAPIVNKGTTVADALMKAMGLHSLEGYYIYAYCTDEADFLYPVDITDSCNKAAKDKYNYVISDEPLVLVRMTMNGNEYFGFELFKKGSTVNDILDFMFGEDGGSYWERKYVYVNGTLVEDRDAEIEWGSHLVASPDEL
jgi:hypothetical protein